MTLPTINSVLRFEYFKVAVVGPSHERMGALSKSISALRIAQMFALISPSLVTNQLEPLSIAGRIEE
jgi:hypothetical protein